MKAVNIKNFGGPEMLEIISCPMPEITADQLLIKIAASGINRPDIIQRKGFYPAPANASAILGLECAGIIERVGKNVSDWKIGDKVCALLTGGGYAEYAAANKGSVLKIPDNLTMVEAAALPETYFTVWSNLFMRAGLMPGETLLIHGGTSGIGTTAIQMAKLFGATVISTSGSDEKCTQCTELGADYVINYKTQDFVQQTHEFTDGKGVDVILDMVAGEYLPRNINVLNEDGRLVIIAVQGGIKDELNMLTVMKKRLTITGSTLRPRNNDFKAEIASALKDKIWPSLEAGKIKPIIDKTFVLDEVAAAHQYLECGKHFGKIVLTI